MGFDSAFLFVRDRRLLVQTHQATGSYMSKGVTGGDDDEREAIEREIWGRKADNNNDAANEKLNHGDNAAENHNVAEQNEKSTNEKPVSDSQTALKNALIYSPEFKDWSVPLGRKFRSLRVWAVLKYFGAKKMREYLMKSINQARMLERYFEEHAERFSIPVRASMGLICFQVKELNSKGGKTKYSKELTLELADWLMHGGGSGQTEISADAENKSSNNMKLNSSTEARSSSSGRGSTRTTTNSLLTTKVPAGNLLSGGHRSQPWQSHFGAEVVDSNLSL
jgi:hypothetical protein